MVSIARRLEVYDAVVDPVLALAHRALDASGSTLEAIVRARRTPQHIDEASRRGSLCGLQDLLFAA